MSQYGFVPKATTDPFQGKLPPVKDFKGPNLSGYVGYMKDAATAYLAAQMAEYPNDQATQKYANIDNLSKGGYKIVTTYNHVMMNDSVDGGERVVDRDQRRRRREVQPAKHASDHDIHLAFASVDPHTGELKSFYTGTDGKEDYNDQLVQLRAAGWRAGRFDVQADHAGDRAAVGQVLAGQHGGGQQQPSRCTGRPGPRIR